MNALATTGDRAQAGIARRKTGGRSKGSRNRIIMPNGWNPRNKGDEHDASWCATKRDKAEQAVCNIVADDKRYAAILMHNWTSAMRQWIDGRDKKDRLVVCQFPEHRAIRRDRKHQDPNLDVK